MAEGTREEERGGGATVKNRTQQQREGVEPTGGEAKREGETWQAL